MKNGQRYGFFLGTAAFLVAVLFFCLSKPRVDSPVLQRLDTGRIVPGITIAGMDMGNRSPREARALLEKWTERQKSREIALAFCGREERIGPGAFGAVWDSEETIHRAMEYGRRGGMDARMQPSYYDLTLIVDRERLRKVVNAVDFAPVEPHGEVDPMDPARIRIASGQDGIQADIAALCTLVEEALLGESAEAILVPGKVLHPVHTAEEVRENTVEIASFSTLYGCMTQPQQARHANISRMCSLVNGAAILPGAVFSLNECVGPRVDPGIWKSAPGIYRGVVVDQLGGGICQFSTALFNCALLADLQILERSPHSIPPEYVDMGRDSMINTGGPDLKLKNTGEYPVIILCRTETEGGGCTLTVSLYGPPAERSIRLESRVVREIPCPDEPREVEDPMLAGPARMGYEAELYAVYCDTSGKELERRMICSSVYPPAPERIWRPAGWEQERKKEKTGNSI